MAMSTNMKYTDITVDACPAAKFYHVLWNEPEAFEQVLILLVTFT